MVLHSKTTEDELSALCFINVHNEIDFLDKIYHIIDIFSKTKNKQFKFVI